METGADTRGSRHGNSLIHEESQVRGSLRGVSMSTRRASRGDRAPPSGTAAKEAAKK